VLAIEAAEGTDAMLARIAELRGGRRLRLKGRAGVLVKAPKRDQDMRLDLPAVGLKTIEGAKRAELAGIALAAGRVLIADRDAFARAADEAGLFVVGMET
jgi:UDP-2,3-diacylglucosamine hydrolase